MRAGDVGAALTAGRVQVAELITLVVRRGVLTPDTLPNTPFTPNQVVEDACTWASVPMQGSGWWEELPAMRRLERSEIEESDGQELPSVVVECSDETWKVRVAGVGWRGMDRGPGYTEEFNPKLQELATRGLLDGSRLVLESLWSASFGPIRLSEAARVVDFAGFVQRALPRPGGVMLEAQALPGRASRPMPRHLVTPYCRHEYLAVGCGVGPDHAWSAIDSATVIAWGDATRTRFRCSGRDPAFDRVASYKPWWDPDWQPFRLGRLEFRRGKNLGWVAAIERLIDRGPSGGPDPKVRDMEIELAAPGAPWAPEPGDVVRFWPGCNKTEEYCRRFHTGSSNSGRRHGGFPFLPPPETMGG